MTNFNYLKVTDAHVHLWDPGRLDYPWLDDVTSIKQSFGLAEYRTATAGISIEKMIFVQCECLPEQYESEVAYVRGLAALDNRIQGIVAYFPLERIDAEERIVRLAAGGLVKGIRRLEEQPVSLYKSPSFVAGMDLLLRHGLSFDLCVKAHQLDAAVSLVQAKPDVRYMLDHAGKPAVRSGEFTAWKAHLSELAKNPNVYCKLSGLVTEADWAAWTTHDLTPYVETVIELFGPARMAFGSDWPVVTLASSYKRWFDVAVQLCNGLTTDELDLIFYKNALDFYQIVPTS